MVRKMEVQLDSVVVSPVYWMIHTVHILLLKGLSLIENTMVGIMRRMSFLLVFQTMQLIQQLRAISPRGLET